jgi:hypothetical protein
MEIALVCSAGSPRFLILKVLNLSVMMSCATVLQMQTARILSSPPVLCNL